MNGFPRMVGLAILAGLLAAALPAAAEDLKVPLHKAQIIRLDRDANIVMVADPSIVDPVVESPRMIFLIGRSIGDTNIHILDQHGKEIMVSDVTVVSDVATQLSLNRGAFTESTYSCSPRCRYLQTPGSSVRVEDQQEHQASPDGGVRFQYRSTEFKGATGPAEPRGAGAQ